MDEFKHVALGILLWMLYVKVSGVCDSATEFTCTNNKCVKKEWTNDSINDCGDNSDEGVPQQCARADSFKCTQTILASGLQGVCYALDWVNDGVDDCPDGSDEWKRLLGSRCMNDLKGEFPPLCSSANNVGGVGNGAECDTSNRTGNYRTCQCKLGWMENARRSTCTKRVLGDPCQIAEDCSAADDALTCKNGKCWCKGLGYTEDPTNTFCIKKILGAPCTTTPECTVHVPFAFCHPQFSTCQCTEGLIGSRDLLSCMIHKIIGKANQPTSSSTTGSGKETTTSSTASTFQTTTTGGNETTTPPPFNIFDTIDRDTLIYIGVGVGIAIGVVGLGAMFLILLIVCYANNQLQDQSEKKKTRDMATNSDFAGLEALLAPKSLSPIMLQVVPAAVHYNNEMLPMYHYDPTHITPNDTPNFSPNVSDGSGEGDPQHKEDNQSAQKYLAEEDAEGAEGADGDVGEYGDMAFEEGDTIDLLGAELLMGGMAPVAMGGSNSQNVLGSSGKKKKKKAFQKKAKKKKKKK